MKRFLVAFGLVWLVLLVAGCGGGRHYAGPQKTVAQGTVQGHQCSPTDFYMQCALRTQKAPRTLAPRAGLPHGVDFAWGAPPCGTFHANGWSIAATYFDTHDMSKGWSRGLVDSFSACGVSHIAVWESTAGRATGGYGAGVQDARDAQYVANLVGMQPGRPIFFAVDCDCSGSSVAAYFDGVKSVLGLSRTGAYAGYYPIKYLFDTGRIAYGWQTYAWSGGNRDGRAHFYQYLNDGSVDYDSTNAADYGQWPYNAGPTPQQVGEWIKQKKAAMSTWNTAHCGGTPQQPGCVSLRRTVVGLQDKFEQQAGYPHIHCFGPLRKTQEAVCYVLRPTEAYWSRARDSSRSQLLAHNCTVRDKRSTCVLYRQRVAYFQLQVNWALTNH